MGNVHIGVETIRRIERGIHKDQGGSYRQWLEKVLPHIGDAYRGEEDGHRSHLGASVLGKECARAVYYNFRWVTKSNFSGRMMRLFNRGHLEEGRIIAALLSIDCEIFQQDENGKQYRISFAEGHCGGSGDGIIKNVPDLPVGMPALGEFKTHNDKSFTDIAGANWKEYVEYLLDPSKPTANFQGKGVRESKFEHYVQANLYMLKMGLAVCVYVAINKNDDSMYVELIPLDTAMSEQFINRGEKIVRMDRPPDKINKSPGFYKCRFCDHRPVCHKIENAQPDVNCRTCVFSSPVMKDGLWQCSKLEKFLSKEEQLAGCTHYQVNKCL